MLCAGVGALCAAEGCMLMLKVLLGECGETGGLRAAHGRARDHWQAVLVRFRYKRENREKSRSKLQHR